MESIDKLSMHIEQLQRSFVLLSGQAKPNQVSEIIENQHKAIKNLYKKLEEKLKYKLKVEKKSEDVIKEELEDFLFEEINEYSSEELFHDEEVLFTYLRFLNKSNKDSEIGLFLKEVIDNVIWHIANKDYDQAEFNRTEKFIITIMDQFYGKYGKYAKIKGFRIPDKEINDMFKGLINYPKRRVKDYCHAFYHVYNVNPGDDPKLDFFYKHLLIACENIGLII